MKPLTDRMISEPTYKAARLVAEAVEKIFTEHLRTASANGETNLAQIPTAFHIESIIDTAFWTSLRHEEGRSPRISLAYLPPWQAGTGQPIVFANRIPLSPGSLTKLSAGFERAGVHLGVWHEHDELYVWGATLTLPDCCFVLDVSEPGLVVIKHRRSEGYGKFSNIAVLSGDEIKIVDEHSASQTECPTMLRSLLDFSVNSMRNDSVNVLLQLAVSMRAHKRGGTLLVVPTATSEWQESIRTPFHYSVEPEFSGLANLIRQDFSERSTSNWQRILSKEVDILGGLTAIDGATIINDQYELLAFGEKIRRRTGGAMIEQVINTEPILNNQPVIVYPALTGGTRHLSAAQFVLDQQDAMALVASQDGRFTVFTWSECDQMVQAHRIDSLLL